MRIINKIWLENFGYQSGKVERKNRQKSTPITAKAKKKQIRTRNKVQLSRLTPYKKLDSFDPNVTMDSGLRFFPVFLLSLTHTHTLS